MGRGGALNGLRDLNLVACDDTQCSVVRRRRRRFNPTFSFLLNNLLVPAPVKHFVLVTLSNA